jgi:preprotein translocase subunit YajC
VRPAEQRRCLYAARSFGAKGTHVSTVLVLAQSDAQQGGNALSLLLPLVLMGGVFYFFLIRPQRAQRQRQQSLLSALEVGDEVLTIAGMYGTIVEIDDDDDTVIVEVAPGTRVRMVRRAVSQRLTEDGDYDDADDADDETPGEGAAPRP